MSEGTQILSSGTVAGSAKCEPSFARLQPGASYGGHPSRDARLTRPAIRSRERSERLAKDGGEGGIRTLSGPLDSVSYRFHNASIAVNAGDAGAPCTWLHQLVSDEPPRPHIAINVD